MKLHPVAKLATELGPLAIFFVVNGQKGIFAGTAAFMAATVVALGISWVITRTIPLVPLVTGVFVVVFGGLTLYLANDLFIKVKPTLVNLTFAGILGFGLLTGRMFLKLVLGTVVELTARGWLVLTRAWIGYLVFLAAANEVVWRTASTEFWIAFKAFGVMPMTMAFSVLSLIPVMQRYTVQPENAPENTNDTPVDKA